LKSIQVGETVTYLGREHSIEDVTEQGVKLKRVNALPNEFAIYIRKGSDRFFKIFSKDFDVENIEATIEDGADVRLERTIKKSIESNTDEEDLNDFIVTLTKKHTDLEDKEAVTNYLRGELFNFEDKLNSLKRFTISCWLNRRVLVKFQTESIEESLAKVKNRVPFYTDELRLFIESALGDITEPSAKELKSLVSLIPEEDSDLIISIIKGFDLPLLWLNQTEVKQMLKEADEASNNTNKIKREFMKTIKNLSDNTIAEMNELFANEAEARGLNEEVTDTTEDGDEMPDFAEMSLKELRAYCKEEDIDLAGAKTKKAILDILFEEDEDEDGEAYEEEELDEMTLKDLREIASEDFEIAGASKMKKPALIEAILEAQEEDEDEMPDFAEMSLKELRAECKEEGIDTKGLKKPELIEELEALYE